VAVSQILVDVDLEAVIAISLPKPEMPTAVDYPNGVQFPTENDCGV